LADFVLRHQIKIMPLTSAQHSPIKVSYVTRKAYQFQPFTLTRNEIEEANKAVAKVLEWKMVQRVL